MTRYIIHNRVCALLIGTLLASAPPGLSFDRRGDLSDNCTARNITISTGRLKRDARPARTSTHTRSHQYSMICSYLYVILHIISLLIRHYDIVLPTLYIYYIITEVLIILWYACSVYYNIIIKRITHKRR